MDAVETGFGHVVPSPSFHGDLLGGIVFINEGGSLTGVGNIFNDGHFKRLAEENNIVLDKTTTEEQYPSLTAAFTTGGLLVQPLDDEDYKKYVYV